MTGPKHINTYEQDGVRKWRPSMNNVIPPMDDETGYTRNDVHNKALGDRDMLLRALKGLLDRHDKHWYGGGHGDPYNPFDIQADHIRGVIALAERETDT